MLYSSTLKTNLAEGENMKCVRTGCGKTLTKANRAYSLKQNRDDPYSAICKECRQKDIDVNKKVQDKLNKFLVGFYK